MKNMSRFSWLVFLFALAAPAQAAVLWTSTFESNKSGDVCSSNAATSEWKPGINETKVVGGTTRKNAEVLGEQVYSGSLACKITVHPDDTFTFGQNRVDIQHPSTLTGEGKDLYLSGHYMMPTDAKVRNEIGFFETVKPSYQNWLDFWVEPKAGGGTTLALGIEFLGAIKIWSGDFIVGKWHQIAIHVHWSTNAQMGTVDFWLDGQQVVTAYKHKTKPNPDDFFFQTGLHRKDTSTTAIDTIYFDDFIEGDQLADIKIGMPASNDGGMPSTDADGVAGSTGSAGSVGTAGTAGTAGIAGAAGSTGGGVGTAGSTGAAGSMSAAGSTGAAGSTSTAGSTGASGAAGTAGATGGGATTGSGCSCAVDDALNSQLGLLLAVASLVVRRSRRAR
ncbi:MAG: hypothetical protein JWM82_4322 [Myxococcales bacterium]|nr:hypothetical protein [Myxococcales bacterium]